MKQKSFIKLILIGSILVTLVVLVGGVVLSFLTCPRPSKTGLPAVDSCSYYQGTDCISVKGDCCGCAAGGAAIAINKKFEKEWQDMLLEECRDIFCPEVISNDPSCFKEPKCVESKCVLEEPEKEITVSTDKTEYEQGEVVEIKIQNNFGEVIQVSGPPHFFIEKFENGKWTQIKEYVGCPCESSNCQMKIMGPWRVEPKSEILLFNRELKIRVDCKGVETIWWEVTSGRYRISAEIIINETKTAIYSNEFTIKEKSAIDPRCSQRARAVNITSGSRTMVCMALGRGIEFNSSEGKCIAVKFSAACSVESPFETLEECQKVCETNNEK